MRSSTGKEHQGAESKPGLAAATPTELKQLVASRGSMYALLARVYREETDRQILERIRRLDLSACADLPDISEGRRMVVGFLQETHADSLTDLAVDFARLFLGGRHGGAAPPYESVYVSPDHLLMQGPRDAVAATYREEGLDRAPGLREPEDHLALELEFMAHLCLKTAEALAGGRREAALACIERQQDFLGLHLSRWVPAFCEDVTRLAKLDFYRGMARITLGFLRLEQETLGRLATAIQSE